MTPRAARRSGGGAGAGANHAGAAAWIGCGRDEGGGELSMSSRLCGWLGHLYRYQPPGHFAAAWRPPLLRCVRCGHRRSLDAQRPVHEPFSKYDRLLPYRLPAS